MIYILTGMAKTGKSILANTLSKETGYSITSTDHIMMMFHKANPALGINASESDPSVSKALEPYVRAWIETLIQNKENQIIEGVHFLPSFSRELLDKYPKEIKILYLGYKDWTPQEKMDDLIKYKNHTRNCWYEHYSNEELLKLTEYLMNESKKLFDEVQAYQLDYVEAHNIVVQSHMIMRRLLKK